MTDSESISPFFRFSRKQVQKLAERLAQIHLSDDERELLLAIFSAARDNVTVLVPPSGSDEKDAATPADAEALPADAEALPADAEAPPASLSEQIVNAFIPDDQYVIQEGAMRRISPAGIRPPPPHKEA